MPAFPPYPSQVFAKDVDSPMLLSIHIVGVFTTCMRIVQMCHCDTYAGF